MLNRIKAVLAQLKPMSDKEKAYKYLAESYDHVDLERRMKELDKQGIRWY